MKSKYIFAYVSFAVIMIALGVSDALRGIFAPVFQSHFSLNATQLSMIITVSYMGNLIFLLCGGYLADRYKRKKVAVGVIALWVSSLFLYMFTDQYGWLLVGMFLSMGASTLMNTMINIMTPLIFIGTRGMMINTLFFIQGIGTTGSQKIVGTYANEIGSWKLVNGILAVMGLIGIGMLLCTEVPEKKENEKQNKGDVKYGFSQIVGNKAFFYLIWILGFYFIAEHGILNWLVTYCNRQYGFSTAQSATYVSIFFGGITIGRLLFSPLISKWGVYKSIGIFGGVGSILYIIGSLMGERTIFLLSAAGLFLSILYPTLIFMIQDFFEDKVIATATGMIISAATLFDIGFNALFGTLVDRLGFQVSFQILPLSMLLFYICYILFRMKVRPIR